MDVAQMYPDAELIHDDQRDGSGSACRDGRCGRVRNRTRFRLVRATDYYTHGGCQSGRVGLTQAWVARRKPIGESITAHVHDSLFLVKPLLELAPYDDDRLYVGAFPNVGTK